MNTNTSIKNTIYFDEKINENNIKPEYKMISLVFKNVYTSIPKYKTVNI
jgi:hypothetical protein